MLAFAFQFAARGGAIEVVRALEERQVRFSEAVREPDPFRRCHARDTRGVFVTQASPIDRMVKV